MSLRRELHVGVVEPKHPEEGAEEISDEETTTTAVCPPTRSPTRLQNMQVLCHQLLSIANI